MAAGLHAEAQVAIDINMQCCSLKGIASTPFLAGLDRTLPQLTPGISPEALAMFQAAVPPAAMLAAAKGAAHCEANLPEDDAAPPLPQLPQHSSPSAADLAQDISGGESPESASAELAAASFQDGAYEGLLNLSPMPGNYTHSSNTAMLESPDLDALSTLGKLLGPAGSAGSKPTPVLFTAAPVAAHSAAPAPQQWSSNPAAASESEEPASDAAQMEGLPHMAALQEAESVGSASPADAAAMQSRASVPAASDTGASAVRAQAAAARVGPPCIHYLHVDMVLAFLCSRDIYLHSCSALLHTAVHRKIELLPLTLHMQSLGSRH